MNRRIRSQWSQRDLTLDRRMDLAWVPVSAMEELVCDIAHGLAAVAEFGRV
jgi:hypothetical protein